jgi:hypothetical protein
MADQFVVVTGIVINKLEADGYPTGPEDEGTTPQACGKDQISVDTLLKDIKNTLATLAPQKYNFVYDAAFQVTACTTPIGQLPVVINGKTTPF